MIERLGVATVIVFLIVCALIIGFMLYEFYRVCKYKHPIGEISVSKNDEGQYVWSFSFYDNVTYDAIENMDKVTFKVKKENTDGADN